MLGTYLRPPLEAKARFVGRRDPWLMNVSALRKALRQEH